MKIDLNKGMEYSKLEIKKEIEGILSKNLGVSSLQVQLTNGANGALQEVISQLALKYFNENRKNPIALISTPNFWYTERFLNSSFYKIVKVKRNKQFRFQTEKFIEQIRLKKPFLTILTTPNNPTGIPIDIEDIYQIMNSISENAYIIIDKACLNIGKEINLKELLNQSQHINLILIDSYSKSHNLSSERIGWFACSNESTAKYFRESEDIARVTYSSMCSLMKVIDNNTILIKNKHKIKQSINLLKEFGVKNPSFEYSNTKSNFVMAMISSLHQKKLLEKFDFIYPNTP